MRLDQIHHIAIIASDYERSKRFYSELLGFSIVREEYRKERDSYKLDLRINDTTSIELFSFPRTPPRLSHPEATGLRHLAFSVQDVDAVFLELQQKGIQPEDLRVEESTGKRLFFFHDPDGLPIEIHEP